jgi:hypothetical protein
MPFLIATILLQVICVAHCIRTGRNQLWLMAIIFLPIAGSLAYLLVEVLPGLTGRREVRAVKAAAVQRIDPERELRAAADALDTADTAANRIRIADRLAELGRWGEAVSHYEAGLAKAPQRESGVLVRLARAQFEMGQVESARATLEMLPETRSQGEADRANLLLARVLEELGERERALALYADVGERLPGGEAQCRQAGLLIALGRRNEALAPLLEVQRRLKHLDRHERTREREMYDWAERTLRELQSGS